MEELIRLQRELCVKCGRPYAEWSIFFSHGNHHNYCCEGCEKNAGCTCEADNEGYLAERSFA